MTSAYSSPSNRGFRLMKSWKSVSEAPGLGQEVAIVTCSYTNILDPAS